VVLGGTHIGCFELFAREGIRSAADLKGKSVGLSASPVLLRLMAAQVGLNPKEDLRWVTDPALKPMELFARVRSTGSWDFRRSRRSCALATPGTSFSTPLRIAHGRSISAA